MVTRLYWSELTNCSYQRDNSYWREDDTREMTNAR